MRFSQLALTGFLSLTLAPEALSQINSPGARTLFARSFLYRSDWRFPDGNTLVWENAFVYGVAPRVMAIAVVSLVSQSGLSSGLGDPTFFVQYDGLYHRNRPGGFTRLAGFFGVRPPWGQEAFSSGETSHVPGVVFTHATPRWFLNGDFQWTARGESGDVLQADASVMYRLLTYPQLQDLFLVLELDRVRDQASPRDAVYLSPGAEWFFRPNVALELSVQIPLHQDGDPVWVTGLRYVH